MFVTIPVVVSAINNSDLRASSPEKLHTARPLFFPHDFEQTGRLQTVLANLADSLRRRIETSGKEARHDEIARMCFAPAVAGNTVDFKLNFGAGTFACKYFVAQLSGFGKKLAFAPALPDVWFEIERGENLTERAATIFDEHFRRLERRDGRGSQNPELYNSNSKVWLTTVDFDAALPQVYEPEETNLFALLGASGKMNGAEELYKTGRQLDRLFPAELERAVLRENELAELTEYLDAPDQRPVLLVGKKSAGKTALVHEYVFRGLEKRANPHTGERNTWLLTPQRLVAGMMYVGQWEERFLAILKEAETKRHLLYFDDVLGLFLAGQSANSSLSMAQVVKPFLEKRQIRFLGETTPEALRVLQERDRGFADLFQIVRVNETNDRETLRITLAIRRELEQKHGCFFALDALPVALDLQRRYNREAAFPGKIARFLNQLAVKFNDKVIARADVLREFEQTSGMSIQFLDDKAKLDRREIIEKIQSGVVGQTTAIKAAADAISVAKARLNDVSRPLASFLFLGATGVGKTEAAKQIAEYLYGDAEKLLRFDMNEFVSAFDAARLVGTFDQPEGLLTNAIRRQPFAVILLDEIEKAHPNVFNLLLQVLGDGRLTDALGRTADFSNAIIVLTSNLGAREANAKPGFRQTEESEAATFVRAAEKFFKPEFFNRFDRVVPFERLSRADVEQIAEKQLQKVFARDGFVRRNCKLEVESAAMQLIINEGYHPQLGARALKRAIEKRLIQPIAAHLAALAPDAPVVVRVAAENEQIVANVEEIRLAEIETSVWLAKDFTDVDAELDRIADALDRIEDRIEPLKPPGEILPNDARQARYFLVRDRIESVERMIRRAERWNERDNSAEVQSSKFKVQSQKRRLVTLRDANVDLNKILGESNLSLRLKELAATNRAFGDEIADYIQDIWRETALTASLLENLDDAPGQTAVLRIETPDRSAEPFAAKLLELYKQLFARELHLQIGVQQPLTIELSGANAHALARAETGTHLFVTENQGFVPLVVRAENNDESNNSVVRIYDARAKDLRFALDARSGLLASDVLTARELRAFVLSGLQMPEEIFSREGGR